MRCDEHRKKTRSAREDHDNQRIFLPGLSRLRVDTKGSDSIETTNRSKNAPAGTRQDTMLVRKEKQPLSPVREVSRKTEILGTGFRSRSHRKTQKNPDGDDDGNEEH
ncbi:MAG: hypothetical protein WC593_01915 [Methanoregula sp.]